MKKATCIAVSVVAAVLGFLCLAAAALALGLVFGLGLGLNNNYNNNNNDTNYNNTNSTATATTEQPTTLVMTTTASIVRTFVDNVTFPAGSYVIPLSNLSTDPSVQAPSIVNFSVLIQVGIEVDPNNIVLVSRRKTFLYFAVPSQQSSTTNRKLRNVPDSGLCVQFGTSNNCHIVPYDFPSIPRSLISLPYFPGSLIPRPSINRELGFQPVTHLFNGETLYQLPISAPPFLCPPSIGSQCVSVPYQAYVISRDSRSPASVPSILFVACGSQCQGQQGRCKQPCQTCNYDTVTGRDTPVTRRYHMQGVTSGSFQFVYGTYSTPDRMRIYQDDEQIFDSGCVGTNGERKVTVTFTGFSDEIRVDVEPNCTGTLGADWYFYVGCPSTD